MTSQRGGYTKSSCRSSRCVCVSQLSFPTIDDNFRISQEAIIVETWNFPCCHVASIHYEQFGVLISEDRGQNLGWVWECQHHWYLADISEEYEKGLGDVLSYCVGYVIYHNLLFEREFSLSRCLFYRGGHMQRAACVIDVIFTKRTENLIMSLNSELTNPSRHPRRCIWGELCWISEPPCKILTLLQSFNGSIHYLRQSGLKYWQARQWLFFFASKSCSLIATHCIGEHSIAKILNARSSSDPNFPIVGNCETVRRISTSWSIHIGAKLYFSTSCIVFVELISKFPSFLNIAIRSIVASILWYSSYSDGRNLLRLASIAKF